MDRVDVVVLGIFVADLAFRNKRLRVLGETIRGRGFAIGHREARDRTRWRRRRGRVPGRP